MITVSKLRQPSAAALRQIIKINKQLLPEADHGYNESYLRATIRKGLCYLLKYDKKIAGVMTLAQYSKLIEIDTLAIKKKYQRKGIGREAIKVAINRAKKEKFDKLEVGSYFKYKARGFYEKNGFKMVRAVHDGCYSYWDFAIDIP